MLWPLVGTYSKYLQQGANDCQQSVRGLVKDSTAMNNMRAT